MRNTTFKLWLATARPKTLPLALASILSGSALAYWDQHFSWLITLLCLLTATLLQILSNFANDYGDHVKGSDTAERIGPLRAIQQGSISAAQLKRALLLLVAASLCSGTLLIIVTCHSWTDFLIFALFGVLAIVASITYTVGRKPYGYIGLGDLSVLIFFGLVAVGGAYYLQTHHLNLMILLPALSCGLLATAVLNINNLRDIEQDRKVGKTTMAVRLGSINGRRYHILLLSLAMLGYLVFALCYARHWANFAFLLSYPLLIKHFLFVYRHQDPQDLRPMLEQMSILALITNLLFSFGLLLS